MGSPSGNLKLIPISESFQIIFDRKRVEISIDLEAEINSIWKAEKTLKGDRLTNGGLLCVNRIEENKLVAYRTDYRHFLAQVRRPQLFKNLQIRTLAVSGLLKCNNDLLLGLRSKNCIQQPEHWELVPSGGLSEDVVQTDNHVAFKDQLLLEMEEETGIQRINVERIVPVVLIEDFEHHVLDICMEVFLKNIDLLQSRSDEYDDLRLVPFGEIAHFSGSHKMVPASKSLLKFLNYTKT